MQTRNRGDYTIAGCELVAEGADLRVQVLSLASGQCIPWHYHSEISDSFVCLEGPMVVETRAPRHVYRLSPGERCAVPPKTAHYVHGEADGPCKFLIVQGGWRIRLRAGRQGRLTCRHLPDVHGRLGVIGPLLAARKACNLMLLIPLSVCWIGDWMVRPSFTGQAHFVSPCGGA